LDLLELGRKSPVTLGVLGLSLLNVKEELLDPLRPESVFLDGE
jgi:hypothetical protein